MAPTASRGRTLPRRLQALPRRLRALPLRWRLLGVALGLIVTALALTALVVSVLLHRYLVGQTEQELKVYAASIASITSDPGTELGEVKGRLPTGFTVRTVHLAQGRVESITEAVTTQSPPVLPVLSPASPQVTPPDTSDGRPFEVPSASDDGSWMAIAQLDPARTDIHVVALPLAQLDRTVDQFLLYAAAIGGIALLACALLGWYLINATFRPLRRIEDTAAGIASGDLTRRVDVPDTDDEVASLSHSLNAMLTRIEHSFALREANESKMRRFIADASHELRTPLAAVGGYAELYRQGALQTPDAVTGAMGRIESETHRMSGLVEDLLMLARLDGERPLELQEVDLAVLAADAAQDARTIDPTRPYSATGTRGPIEPTELVADERQLRQVVTNLVTNARVHTPAGTGVEILVGRVAGSSPPRVALHVRDHGPGIAPTDRANVFERFYRADWSRSRNKGGGNGLGLAIVQAIVDAHGGSVSVVDTRGGGATVVVELPVRPRPTPAEAVPTNAGSAAQVTHRIATSPTEREGL